MKQKHPFPDLLNSEIGVLIDDVIHNERDRAIMKRRLCDGVFFEPLAEEFGMSTQQVKAIYSRCIRKLSKHIK